MSSVPAFPLTRQMRRAAEMLCVVARQNSIIGEKETIDAEDALRLFLSMRSSTVTQARILQVTVSTLTRWKEAARKWRQRHAPSVV